MIKQAQELAQLFFLSFFSSFFFFFPHPWIHFLHFSRKTCFCTLVSAFASLTCFNLVPALHLAVLVTPVRAREGSAGGLLLLPKAPARARRDPMWHPATSGSITQGWPTDVLVRARPSTAPEAPGRPHSSSFIPAPQQLGFSWSQLKALLQLLSAQGAHGALAIHSTDGQHSQSLDEKRVTYKRLPWERAGSCGSQAVYPLAHPPVAYIFWLGNGRVLTRVEARECHQHKCLAQTPMYVLKSWRKVKESFTKRYLQRRGKNGNTLVIHCYLGGVLAGSLGLQSLEMSPSLLHGSFSS